MDMRERIISVIEANPEFSVRSVSLAAGMSDSMLNKFLKGHTDSMTIKTAEKLADALCVDAQWLIFGEGTPERAGDLVRTARRVPADQQETAQRVLEALLRTGTDG